MAGRTIRGLWWLAALPVVTLTIGCTSSPTGRLPFTHDCNTLTTEARAIRQVSCPPPGAARELDKQVADPYVVEPGDVLLVQPANLDSPVRLPGDQIVLPDGIIQLGRYGRICVAGKTVEAIEVEINALMRTQAPEAGAISVRLVTRDSKVFYVLGEVNAPGAFPLRGRETTLDALIAAGGLSSKANRHGIILTRPTMPDGCRMILPVEYNDIVQLGDTTTNYQIRAGDRVFVPSKSMWEDLMRLFKGHKKPWCRSQAGCATCGEWGTSCCFAPAQMDRPALAVSPAAPVVSQPVGMPTVLPAPALRPPDLLPPTMGRSEATPGKMPLAPPARR